MCEHFPSGYISYNWETDMFYCVLCDKEFHVDEDNFNIKENNNG
jgi:hypothetical protein